MTRAEFMTRREALLARYPYMFAGQLVGDQSAPHERRLEYAIWIEPGWLDIVEQLCADIDNAVPCELKLSDGRGFHIRQIKEKFGTLRFYWNVELGPSEPLRIDMVSLRGSAMSFIGPVINNEPWRQIVRGLVAEAERRSSAACFFCGHLGTIRKRDGGGRIETSCDRHAGAESEFDP